MAGVFISYRRGDGGWAGRLKDHLKLRFGDNLVFRDVDNIEPGQNFPKVIEKAIKNSNAVLIIVGPYWAIEGLTRFKNEDDILRQEIMQALKSKATVIPILVGGALMPAAKDLPSTINSFVQFNAATIHDDDWGRCVQLLMGNLQQIVRTTGTTENLPDLHDKIMQKEMSYFQMIVQEPAKALEIAQQTLKLLDEQMPRYPQDFYLQIQRGYFLKNESMAFRDLDDNKHYLISLSKAEQVFVTIKDESKIYLASAYNGIGSVQFLKKNFKEALQWIDLALELMPDYPAALHDRKELMKHIKRKN